jgi:hypothetical protein
MAEILGINAVLRALKKSAALGSKEVVVVVGFTQSYGIYVHENLGANHPVGQAKFLEQPAREMAGDIATVVRTALKRGATLEQSMLLGGLRLQRESQKLVPVDTGALKGSAFTALEDDADAAAEEAFSNSQAIREQALADRRKKE